MYDLPKQVKSIRIKRKAPETDTSSSKKSKVADDSMEYTEVLDDTCLDSDEINEGDEANTTDVGTAAAPAPAPAPTIQFTLSYGGSSLQAILNRYIYFLFSSAHVAGVRKWRCVDYKFKRAGGKCPAFIVTKGNIVMYRTNPHNHGYHDKKILRKVQLKQVFSAIEDVPVSKASTRVNETDFNDKKDIVIVQTEPTEPLRQDGRDETRIEGNHGHRKQVKQEGVNGKKLGQDQTL